MDADIPRGRSLVIGATGLVGGYLLGHLLRNGEVPYAMSRSARTGDGADWIVGDLEHPDRLQIPAIATLYCTADAKLLAR